MAPVAFRLSVNLHDRDAELSQAASHNDYFQVRVIAPDIAAIRQLVIDLRATGVVQGTRTMLGLETLFEKSPLGYPLQGMSESPK